MSLRFHLLIPLVAVLPLAGALRAQEPPTPTDPRVVKLVKDGQDLLQAKRIRDARARFEGAIELDQGAWEAWEGLGLTQFRQEDLAGSLESLERAVSLAPASCRTRTALARTQHALGREEVAIASIQEAIRREQGCLPARTYLANLRIARGEFSRAVQPLREWIDLAPRYTPLALQLGAAVQLAESLTRVGRQDEAIEVLHKLAARERNLPQFRMRRAVLYETMRHFSHAESELRAILGGEAAGQVKVQAQDLLAQILWQTDRFEEAAAVALEVTTADPNRPMAEYTLGRARFFLDDLPGALEAVNRARRGTRDAPLAALPDMRAVYRPTFTPQPGAHLVEQAAALGIDDRGKGQGSTWADLDGDGALDLIAASQEYTSYVYLSLKDEGATTYRQVAGEVGLGNYAAAYTNLVGDLNADGVPDVYGIRSGYLVGRDGFDHNVLRLGEGTGEDGLPSYRDAGLAAGADNAGQGFSGTLADFDADGDLDIYVVNYNSPNSLLLNRGDATFQEVGAIAGVDDAGGGQGIAVGDIDGDGDLDIFVANKHHEKIPGRPGNVLYRNDGLGGDGIPRFSEIAGASGVAGDGTTFAPTFADLDNDGDLDLMAAAFNSWDGSKFIGWNRAPGSPHRLYRNDGKGPGGIIRFTDVSGEAGIDRVGGSMGISAGDLDNDGLIDLYVSMGGPDPGRYEPDLLFHNLGGMKFEEVAASWGAGSPGRSHGVTMVDVDEDGDLDVYVPNGGYYPGDGAPNLFYRNDGANGSWLRVSLRGGPGNPTAIGARVVVRTKDGMHLRDLVAGSGFCSQDPPVLHFGLGGAASYESVEVRWPGGGVTRLPGGKANEALAVEAPRATGPEEPADADSGTEGE